MEKLLRRMAALLLACVLVCAHAGALPVAAAGNYGLTLDNGVVKLDGKPYYAMGVNLYDAFLVQLRANEKDTRELDAEFKQLHDSGIPLARISMCSSLPLAAKKHTPDEPVGPSGVCFRFFAYSASARALPAQ